MINFGKQWYIGKYRFLWISHRLQRKRCLIYFNLAGSWKVWNRKGCGCMTRWYFTESSSALGL